MSFIKKKKQIQFEPETLAESTAYLQNPSCGWYRIYPFAIEEKPDFEQLYWCLRAEENIVLALIDIGAFRDEEISGEALSNLGEILDFFGKHDKEVILRITYDREGRGMEHEPDFLKTVTGHMRQLGAVLLAHREQILVVQGVLIGSWGEMHDSKFLSEERLKQLAQVWREVLGDIAIAVRTPQQWRLLQPERRQTLPDRMGLFNDGMFGSADDLGTYGCQKKSESGWDGKWCREEEIEFTGRIASSVPYGGEVVEGSLELPFEEVAQEMRRTGVCYLNCTHDEKRLQQWKAEKCGEPGVWEKKSVFDYIGCRLGYRFVIRDVELVRKKDPFLRIRMENIGFSTLKDEAKMCMVIEDTQLSARQCHILPENPCSIMPQEILEFTVSLPGDLAASSYDLLLEMRRKRDNRLIFFANAPSMDGAVKLGTYVLS